MCFYPSCLVTTSPSFLGVLEYSSNLVRFQSYSHPPTIEPSQVVPFPPRAKGPRLLVCQLALLLCLPTVSVYRSWALSHTFIERHFHLGDNCLCLRRVSRPFPFISSLRCRYHFQTLVLITRTRSRRALFFCVSPTPNHPPILTSSPSYDAHEQLSFLLLARLHLGLHYRIIHRSTVPRLAFSWVSFCFLLSESQVFSNTATLWHIILGKGKWNTYSQTLEAVEFRS